jgi:hypothetical protein
MFKRQDGFTVELFKIPAPQTLAAGDNRYARESALLIGEILTESGFPNRNAISAELSRKAGKEISKHMLDGYASPARIDHALPLWLAPVLEEVCNSTKLSDWMAEKRGGMVAYGKDAAAQELGRLVLLREQTLNDINARIKRLEAIMQDDGHE